LNISIDIDLGHPKLLYFNCTEDNLLFLSRCRSGTCRACLTMIYR